MKVVMTLSVRDEADVVRQHLTYHLNAGVDLVIVTDNGSVDGTSEILSEFARAGVVQVIFEPVGEFRQREWQTRMARLAATEHRADWVINSDADEFWWPRGGSFHEVLSEIPARYGIVQSFFRHFVPTADDGGPWSERMVYRLNPEAPVNDPMSPWRPFRKVAHRTHPGVTVVEGSHVIRGTDLQPLRGWYPLEGLHFPMRSARQVESKGRAWAVAYEKFYAGPAVTRAPGTAYHALQHQAAERGQSDAYYASLALREDDLRRGVEAGILRLDTRVRDALRTLEEQRGRPQRPDSPLVFPRPTTLDAVELAVDAAVLGEADVIRTQRWLDSLEQRVAAMERMPALRAERLARRLLRRLRGKPS